MHVHKYSLIQLLLTAQKGRMWHMCISTNKDEVGFFFKLSINKLQLGAEKEAEFHYEED